MGETVTLSSIRWDLILGGFGLFMFGITFMGDGLKAAAGDKLRDYIDKYTTKPINALLIGILITIVMQSSSASTAITIGLVRAGLMKLEQAAGVVMGANIGTTITSFLISLNIDQYAMFIVFIGAMLICFSKKRKQKYFGEWAGGGANERMVTKEGIIPAIVDADTWEKVRLRMEKNKHNCLNHGRKDRLYLLSGLMRCGHCNGALVGVTTTSKNTNKALRYGPLACLPMTRCDDVR